MAALLSVNETVGLSGNVSKQRIANIDDGRKSDDTVCYVGLDARAARQVPAQAEPCMLRVQCLTIPHAVEHHSCIRSAPIVFSIAPTHDGCSSISHGELLLSRSSLTRTKEARAELGISAQV
jgi:hypothetical protein